MLATVLDLARLGLPKELLRGSSGVLPFSLEEQEGALLEASQVAESYLAARYQLPLVFELAPVAERNTSGSGAVIDLSTETQFRAALDVSAVSSGGSLSVSLETSTDKTTWANAGAFSTRTSTGREVRLFAGLSRFVRLAWVLTGSASFGAGFSGDDLRGAVCKIAAYNLMSRRGFAPQAGNADEAFLERYQQAVRWLEMVAAGRAVLSVIDSAPEVNEGGAAVYSEARRGW